MLSTTNPDHNPSGYSDQLPPVIIVDDLEVERHLASKFYSRSELKNPLIMMSSGRELTEYLDSVSQGKACMPSIVFLDVRMEGMSGIDVLREIRSKPENMFEPAIHFLTHEVNPMVEEAAFQLGADGFQDKPLDKDSYIDFFNSLSQTLASINSKLSS